MHKLGKTLKIIVLATITCLLGGYLLTTADAQRGPRGEGGPRGFDPEQMERIWILQADSVASGLGLDETTTDALAEAYSNTRQGLQNKMSEAREAGSVREKFREMRDEAAEGLKTSLGSILSADQATAAFESLGGFSFRTDMGANLLSDMLEDESKLHSAVGILMKNEGNRPGGRRGPGSPPGDRGGDRGSRGEKLYQELGTVLSPEQVEEFKSSFDRTGRRGPRGDREGRGPRPQ